MKFRAIYFNILLCLIIIICPQFTLSSDFSQLLGAKTIARNGLGVVSIDGISNIFTNPAALGFLYGQWIEVAVVDRLGQFKFDRGEQGLFRSFRAHHIGLNGGVFYRGASNWALALGYHRVVDHQVEWPYILYCEKGKGFETMAFDLNNRITVDAISPSLAYRSGSFSIGVTASIYRMMHNLNFPLGNEEWYTDHGEAGYQVSYEQDGWTFGGTLGFMLQITDNLRFGSKIQSRYRFNLEGTAKSTMFNELDTLAVVPQSAQVNTDFEMPWIVGIGFGYKLSQHMELNFDALYSFWGNSNEKMAYQFSDEIWQNELDQTNPKTNIRGNQIALDTKNTIDVGVGFGYTPDKGLSFRTGYRYSKSPNSKTTLSMFFPLVDQHWISLGLGYRSGPYMLDATISYGVGLKTNIKSEENPFWSGQYESGVFIQAINLRYLF